MTFTKFWIETHRRTFKVIDYLAVKIGMEKLIDNHNLRIHYRFQNYKSKPANIGPPKNLPIPPRPNKCTQHN